MTPTALVPASLLTAAAAPITEIVRTLQSADGDRLGAPTPCTGYDVGELLAHVLDSARMLESAARKEPASATASAAENDSGRTPGDVPAAVAAALGRLVTAWSDPAAWEGTTTVGGPTPLPAPMIGAMTVGELVVHGWDLGQALGRRPAWDEDVLEFVHREVVATAAMGREMGAYGPEVAVAADAPTLDRLLGATGRDPHWTP